MVMVMMMMVVLYPCGVVWMAFNHTNFCCELKCGVLMGCGMFRLGYHLV